MEGNPMEVSINYLAVVLATLSTLVVGSLWYSKSVFGKQWMKLAGVKEKDIEKAGAYPIVITVLVSFVTAFVLAHFTALAYEFYKNEYDFLSTAVITSVWVWLGFTAARVITHDSFEGRRKKLTLLNVGHELLTFLVMGLVIGLMGV